MTMTQSATSRMTPTCCDIMSTYEDYRGLRRSMRYSSSPIIGPSEDFFFFFSSRRRHTRCGRDWSSDVCSSDLLRGSGLGETIRPAGWLRANDEFDQPNVIGRGRRGKQL